MTLSIGQNHFEGPELNDELERFGDWRRRRRKFEWKWAGLAVLFSM